VLVFKIVVLLTTYLPAPQLNLYTIWSSEIAWEVPKQLEFDFFTVRKVSESEYVNFECELASVTVSFLARRS